MSSDRIFSHQNYEDNCPPCCQFSLALRRSKLVFIEPMLLIQVFQFRPLTNLYIITHSGQHRIPKKGKYFAHVASIEIVILITYSSLPEYSPAMTPKRQKWQKISAYLDTRRDCNIDHLRQKYLTSLLTEISPAFRVYERCTKKVFLCHCQHPKFQNRRRKNHVHEACSITEV